MVATVSCYCGVCYPWPRSDWFVCCIFRGCLVILGMWFWLAIFLAIYLHNWSSFFSIITSVLPGHTLLCGRKGQHILPKHRYQLMIWTVSVLIRRSIIWAIPHDSVKNHDFLSFLVCWSTKHPINILISSLCMTVVTGVLSLMKPASARNLEPTLLLQFALFISLKGLEGLTSLF